MKNNHIRAKDEFSEDFYTQILNLIRENKRAREFFGFVSAVGAAAFSVIAALACSLVALLLTSPGEVRLFERISAVFFALFLPLMMLGAHFLDLLEEKYFNF